MAELGEVRTRVTADTGQFRTAMLQASASTEQFRRTGQLLVQQFRAGDLTARQYAQGVAGLAAQMKNASVQQRGMGLAALNSAKGIGTVRSSLASLAAMSIGVKGTLGTLTSALLFMSVGNLTAIGVVAGIMAVVKGYQLLTGKAKEARDEIRRTTAALSDAFQKRILGPEGEAFNERERLQARQREIAAELGRRRMGAPAGVGVFVNQSKIAQLEAESVQNERAIAEASARIRDVLQEQNDERAKLKTKQEKELEQAQKIQRAYARTAAIMANVRAGAAAAVDFFNRMTGEGRRFILPTDEGAIDPDAMRARARERENRLRQNAQQFRERMVDQFGGIADALAQRREEMEAVGELWARSILTSMVRAFREGNIGKAFANVLGTLLEQVIVGAIIKGLKSAKSGPLGFIGGLLSFQEGGTVPGPQGKPQMAVVHGGETVLPTQQGGTFAVAVPKLQGMALVRDPEWQAMWRETARAANAAGFRMVVV